MKVQTTNIRKRIEVSPRKSEGILNFDIDNAYPQRCDDIVNASPTGKACVGLFAKFVEGGGFKDSTFYKSVCNDHGLTVDKLLRKNAKDYTGHNGIAIHFNYNALYEKTEVNYIPFDHVRLVSEDNEEHAGQYAVYHDWAMEEKSRIDREKLFFIDKYNPDPKVIAEQVMRAGGWDKYKGQILWWSAAGDKYPLPVFDSVLEDMQTESELKLFKNRNVTTNFLASHILITDKIEDSGDEGVIPIKEGAEEEKRPRRTDVDVKEREFMKYLQEYQGADNTGKILWIQKETPEQTIDLKKMDIQDVDKLYQYTETSTRDNIVRSFLQPPILVAILVSGKLGTSKEINDATEFYNKVTDPDRRIMEEIYKQAFSGFHIELNPSGDYSIIPISTLKSVNDIPVEMLKDLTLNERRSLIGFQELENQNSESKKLIETLAVGSITATIAILTDPVLTTEQKKGTLITFGFSEEDANRMLDIKPETE